MWHPGNPRDGATACSIQEPRETALLHGCKVQLHQLMGHGMHIHIFNKVAVRKNYECQKYEKKSPIQENADVHITCDFGDGDISRSRSRFNNNNNNKLGISIAPYTNVVALSALHSNIYTYYSIRLR